MSFSSADGSTTWEEAAALPKGLAVMDGSMGRLTMMLGVPVDDDIWAARGLVEEQYHPIVVEAHASYIKAGAKLITTNNYAVQPNYYRRVFADWEQRIPRDTETAARLAVEARSSCEAGSGVRILGALPPICESHRPDLTAKFIEAEGKEFCVRTYRGIAQALIRGGPVDAFIAETQNSWEEAQLVIEAVKDLGLPLIISMEGALRNEELKPQTHLAAEIASRVLEAKAAGAPIEALGFNCAPPEDILACLEVVQSSGMGARLQSAGVRLAAYANCNDSKKVHDSGFDVAKFSSTPIRVREDLKGSGYLKWCHSFMRTGAAYCGGCCGSTPEVIKELSDSLTGAEEPAASALTAPMEALEAPRSPDGSVSTRASTSEVAGLDKLKFPEAVQEKGQGGARTGEVHR